MKIKQQEVTELISFLKDKLTHEELQQCCGMILKVCEKNTEIKIEQIIRKTFLN
jgi:hypothetical protein